MLLLTPGPLFLLLDSEKLLDHSDIETSRGLLDL